MYVGCRDFGGILFKRRNTITAGGGITFDCCVYLKEEKVFGGTLAIGLITESLGFVQDTWNVMVLFG